jgi:radical SAM protein with 4Fe4S-binding SPASM domain
MPDTFIDSFPLPEFSLWERMKKAGACLSFELEITARCNNNCRHCYINLTAADPEAKRKELSLREIKRIADQAAELGAVWCLITGGEPFLRKDFPDIYTCLKKKGLLVSVFTNAALINPQHIDLFKKYPPRDIEVTVYGVTPETYEAVTRAPGSFAAFTRGLNLLLENGIKVRFKAMALRSNAHELPEIARFCRQRTKDYFRFDPWLHLRFDRDPVRNEEIRSERLSAEEFVAIEQADPERSQALRNSCHKLIMPEAEHIDCNHLFHCGAGKGSFCVSYEGFLRLCSSLWHPECIYDLKKGALADAWRNFVPQVRDMRSDKQDFLDRCRKCPIINLCLWCPAHAYLEAGAMDTPVEYFCRVAQARAKSLEEAVSLSR